LWPFRSRIRRDSANAWVGRPQGATRLAAGQDREAEPAVCLVSKWERRSKEAYSVLAIALGAVARRPLIVPAATAARMLEIACLLLLPRVALRHWRLW